MKFLLLLLLAPVISFAQNFSANEILRYQQTAARVEIITDNYGIPHIYGKSDADAVFGLMYVQCRQNFERVERNYLEVMGRLAEIEGESQLFSDLQMQLIYDTSAAKADYQKSPAWFKKLMDAFADGVNYYLYLNPSFQPRVLKKFEPWFPMMYTDGSISATQMGGLRLADTRALYGKPGMSSSFIRAPQENFAQTLSGSNGFAIAPKLTTSGNSILYINPHVTFYFRTEVHMVSEEGLNVYGAATWGNFFIYQGFNETCGWMHTSSYADVADLYEEKIIPAGSSYEYEYSGKRSPVTQKQLMLQYRKGNELITYPVTAYYTHHGPVMGSRDGKWLSLKERNRSAEALQQSWLRTKAKSFAEFKKVMELKSNNSNNTVYADNQKNIAYWHGNFIPVRNTSYNWALPVDGTTTATEWKGVHKIAETVHLVNPVSGWIQNCNSTPFTASGKSSPKKENYPEYMAPEGDNARAVNAVRLLSAAKNIDIDAIIAIGYDRYLSAFDILLPSLFTAFDALPLQDSSRQKLGAPMQELKNWDRYSSGSSIATTLAVEWAALLLQKAPPARTDRESTNMIAVFSGLAANVSPVEKISLLNNVVQDLQKRFGTWKIAWGDINRFQRNDKSNNLEFSDARWSLPVDLASATWGSLPSYNSRRFQGTEKRYGISGNSFVAAVEFGKRVKAKTIMTGGNSFDTGSPHFTDQAEGFIEGKFKTIHFYKEDVMKNVKKMFQPGQDLRGDL
jgi:acyl-homoserine-lactone acylase